MKRATAAVARFVGRRWWAVLLFWAALTAVLVAVSPAFTTVATYDESAFLPPGSSAIEGGQLLEEGWPGDSFTRNAALVLARDGDELTDADREVAHELIDWLESDRAPDVFGDVTTHLRDERLEPSLHADDGQAMLLLVGLEVSPFTPPANQAVEDLRAHIDDLSTPDGLEVLVTGSAAVAADESRAIDRSVDRTHLITIALVLAILLWVYRSPLAALVPLVTIGVAFLVSLSTVSLLAEAGMDVSSLYETFAIVIVFGAGTDYCLFLISRFHEELELAAEAGLDPSPRLRHGTLTATLVVLAAVIGSSALTTIAGFSAQAVSEFGMFRTIGPAMAITIAITLVTALTLAPALMRMLGEALFWPHRGIRGDHDAGQQPLVLADPTFSDPDLTDRSRAGEPAGADS